MEKIIKNNISGLYELQLGTHLFNSEDQNHFKIEFDKVADILITELPLNVNFENHIPDISIDEIVSIVDLSEPDVPNLTLTRINLTTVEIRLAEERIKNEWFCDISLDFFTALQAELIRGDIISKNLKLIRYFVGGTLSEVIYKIELTSTTIGDAFSEAIIIHNSILNRIDKATEQGSRYIRQLVLSGFQIDVSHLLSGPKQSDKNSKV